MELWKLRLPSDSGKLMSFIMMAPKELFSEFFSSVDCLKLIFLSWDSEFLRTFEGPDKIGPYHVKLWKTGEKMKSINDGYETNTVGWYHSGAMPYNP